MATSPPSGPVSREPDAATGIRPARIIVVTGVSASGKSTVGKALAAALQAPFLDGDSWHPESNVAKMRAGIALTDEDRWPWLMRYAAALRDQARSVPRVVGACSALRRAYRDCLVSEAGEPILFVYLHGSRDILAARIRQRTDHYMPASLLDSQFATLEEPAADENVLKADVTDAVEAIVERVLRATAAT